MQALALRMAAKMAGERHIFLRRKVSNKVNRRKASAVKVTSMVIMTLLFL
jgi:hypothetical protein